MSAKIVEGLKQIINLANSLLGHIDAQNDITIIAAEKLRKLNTQTFQKSEGNKESNQSAQEETMPPKYADGSLRSRGNIYEYRFMYTDKATGKRKQHSVYGSSKKECHEEREKFIAGERKAKTEVKNGVNPTVAEWLNEWYELYKKPMLKPGSLLNIRINTRLYIIPTIGSIRLKNLTNADIQECLNKIDSTNKRLKVASIISNALTQAVVTHKLKYSPYIGTKVKRQRKKPSRALELREQDLLYNGIKDEKLRAIAFFMACTGIGRGEFICLTPADFDFHNLVVTVDKNMDEVTKQISTTKNEYRDRLVPILPEMRQRIAPLLDGLKPDERIYPFKLDALTKAFRDVFKELSIPNASSRTLRHTFASNCYHAGIREKTYQSWMGHSETNTTLNIYTHLLKGDVKTSVFFEYIKKLGRKFGRPGPR